MTTMTTVAALIPRIPRIRFQRSGRVIAIRCTTCRTWRKPNLFTHRSNVCHACTYGAARRRLLATARARGRG
jgi:hypothetical protein